MKSIAQQLTIVLGTAALVLASAGFAGAKEGTQNHSGEKVQTQSRKPSRSGQGQAPKAREQAGAARKLGPGDGTGNQGVRPQDGSGNGSPGRQGAGTAATKGRGSNKGKGSKAGQGTSGSRGSSQGALARSRTRNPNAAGSCDGSGARGRRGSAISGGGRR
jgi:hypothetical protein